MRTSGWVLPSASRNLRRFRTVEDSFVRLQRGLAEVWPALTLRSRAPTPRTNVVVHSLSNNPPAHLAPVLPAYEECFLCLVLGLLRTPESRVVYVPSQPVLPRIVDYWLGLVPGLDSTDAQRRLSLVSLADGTMEPLSAKTPSTRSTSLGKHSNLAVGRHEKERWDGSPSTS